MSPSADDLQMIDYEDTGDIVGNPTSITTYVCTYANLAYFYGQLIGATDGNTASGFYMKIVRISVGLHSKEKGITAGKLVCHAVAAWKYDVLVSENLFYIEHSFGNMNFTEPNSAWIWKEQLPAIVFVLGDVHLLKRLTLDTFHCRGSKVTLDGSTYDAYNNCVNSQPFMGYADKRVLFQGVQSRPRILPSGSLTNDIDLVFAGLGVEWEKKWNALVPDWQTPVCVSDGATTQFPDSADFNDIVPALWG